MMSLLLLLSFNLHNWTFNLPSMPIIIYQDKQDGTLRKFYEVIMQVGGEFMKTITDLKNVTLLAPSNEAWIDANLDELMK